MPNIIIVRGPMASGKSTISLGLAQRIPDFILIDRAYFKDNMLRNIKRENPSLASTLSKEAMFFIAKKLIEEGYNIILTEIRVSKVKEVLGNKNSIFSFYLDCGLEECKRRDSVRQNRYVRPDVVEENHKKNAKPDPENIIINTEINSIDACLDVILSKVRKQV